MSARKACGNVHVPRASGARGRAAALMTASRTSQRSMPKPAPDGGVKACRPGCQPCAARARAQAPAPQRGVVSASRLAPAILQAVAPRSRFSPASQTQPANHGRQPSKRTADLFPSHGGLTMETNAPSFFYDQLKSVPLVGFDQSASEKSKIVGKPLIHKTYTLCEVAEAKRQSVPPRKPAFLRRQNRPLSYPARHWLRFNHSPPVLRPISPEPAHGSCFPRQPGCAAPAWTSAR